MKKASIIVFVLVILSLGYWAFSKKADAPVVNSIPQDSQMVTSPTGIVMEDGSMMDSTKDSLVGYYEDYSPEKLGRATDGKVVLFFKASWCPTCKAVDNDINSHLKDIPKGVSILKVDYDKSTELKKKYGVTYQHTFVQVDKDGSQIAKWSGSPTLSEFLTHLK
ncbi:MAG: thioredoxin family protein [Minisyncoccia bacterium]